MKVFIQITLLTFMFFNIKAQENKHVALVWENDITETSSNLESVKKPYFKKAFYQTENGFPFYVISKITQQNVDEVNIIIIDAQYEKLLSPCSSISIEYKPGGVFPSILTYSQLSFSLLNLKIIFLEKLSLLKAVQ